MPGAALEHKQMQQPANDQFAVWAINAPKWLSKLSTDIQKAFEAKDTEEVIRLNRSKTQLESQWSEIQDQLDRRKAVLTLNGGDPKTQGSFSPAERGFAMGWREYVVVNVAAKIETGVKGHFYDESYVPFDKENASHQLRASFEKLAVVGMETSRFTKKEVEAMAGFEPFKELLILNTDLAEFCNRKIEGFSRALAEEKQARSLARPPITPSESAA